MGLRRSSEIHPLRRFGRLGGIAAVLALAALPLGGAGPAAAQELNAAVRAEFLIDPHFIFLGPNMAAARHLFDNLVDRDADAHWRPGLALSWRPVEDTVWEFKLRPGVTFHDGTPFTAEDVVFSLDRVTTLPNNPNPYTVNMRSIVGFEAVDPLTVRIRTAWPNPVLPGQLTNIFIVSKKAATGAGPAEFGSGKAAIGTGPFKYESFQRGERLVLTRNEAYWGEKPAWSRVVIRVIPNAVARVAALRAGDVDLIDEVPPSDIPAIEKEGKATVYRRPSDRVFYLMPQFRDRASLVTDAEGAPLDRNPFKDLRVRQAVSKAINRPALAERILDGQAVPVGEIVPDGFGGVDPAIKPEPYDPDGARKLLAEAGYPKGFGFTLSCTNNMYLNDDRICQAIGQMLSRVGINTRIETYPSTVFFPKIKVPDNELPLISYATSSSSTRDATHILSLVVHSYDPKKGFGGVNRGNYSNPELDRMIETAISTLDEAKHETLLRETLAAATRDLGQIPLYTAVTLNAARKGIVYQPRVDEQFVAAGARPAP